MGKTWSRGTNSRLPFGVNVNLNLSNLISLPTPGMYISLTPSPWATTIDYPKWTTHMALHKIKLEIRYRTKILRRCKRSAVRIRGNKPKGKI